MKLLAVVLVTCLLSTCSRASSDQAGQATAALPITPPDSVRCAALQPSDSLGTTREGFLQEVIDPRSHARTPRFDDYHEGSYHVDKRDLAKGLLELSGACGIPLHGAIVVGPVGGLWAYYVLALFHGPSGQIRVNNLVMPHARITDKATGVVSRQAVESLYAALSASPLVKPLPSAEVAERDTNQTRNDFADDFLALRVEQAGARLWIGSIESASDTAAGTRLLSAVETILRRLEPTYPDAETRRRRERDT